MPKIITVFILLLFLSFTLPVSASSHNQGQDQEVRQEVRSRIEGKRATIQQHVEELKQNREELRGQRRLEIRERQATRRAEIASKVAELKSLVIERIKAIFTTILDRMTAAAARLEKIVAKINSRIAKLKEKGVNLSAAEAALAGCSDEKTAAQNAIDDSKTKIGAIDTTSARVRDAVHTANSSTRVAKRALQNYHKCLVNVTRMLKASVPKEATESAR